MFTFCHCSTTTKQFAPYEYNAVSTLRCSPTQASLHMHHVSWVCFEKYCGDVHKLPEGFHYSVHDASNLCWCFA